MMRNRYQPPENTTKVVPRSTMEEIYAEAVQEHTQKGDLDVFLKLFPTVEEYAREFHFVMVMG